MKLSDIIESHETPVSELKFLELLKEKTKNGHNQAKSSPLFKFIKTKNDFVILNPNAITRRSKSFVENLIGDLPSWKNYPKHSNSIITYSNRELAGENNDGELYVIIPYDGVRMAVADETSLNDSFDFAITKLQISDVSNDSLLTWFESLFWVANKVGLDIEYTEPTKYSDLKKLLDQLQIIKPDSIKKAKDIQGAGVEVQRYIDFANRRGGVLSFFDEVLNPDSNHFKLLTTYSGSIPQSKEIWVGGKTLAIKQSKYQELYNRGVIV